MSNSSDARVILNLMSDDEENDNPPVAAADSDDSDIAFLDYKQKQVKNRTNNKHNIEASNLRNTLDSYSSAATRYMDNTGNIKLNTSNSLDSDKDDSSSSESSSNSDVEEGEASETSGGSASEDDSALSLSTADLALITDTTGDLTSAAKSTKKPSSKKKKAVRRYYEEHDISVKCFNCGSVGHIAADCTAARVYKPCYLCGLRTHPAGRCPRESCFRCLEEGHKSSECTSKHRYQPVVCKRCGGLNHHYSDCKTPPNSGLWDLSQIRCYVCGNKGHVNCTVGSIGRGALYCANCAGIGHTISTCKEQRMDLHINVELYGDAMKHTKGSSFLQEIQCFSCNNYGHMSRDCPNKQRSKPRWDVLNNRANDNYRNNNSNYNNNSRSNDRRRYSNSNSYSEKHNQFYRDDNRYSQSERKRGRSRERDSEEYNNRNSRSHSRADSRSRERERDYGPNRSNNRRYSEKSYSPRRSSSDHSGGSRRR
jgi:cellular nucleic acid-binding protein